MKTLLKFATIIALFMMPSWTFAQLPAPPETIADGIRPGSPIVTRVYYDDDIAVYFGEGMDPAINWMNDYIKEAWMYMKETYGYFGEDPRIYVVAHDNQEFSTATINTRFDAGFGYRNTIDLGGAWDWENPQQINYEVITHELAHIVEGGGKNVGGSSPSFIFWGDGPWPEIFIYDVYKGINRDEWAQNWFDRMQTSTGTHLGGGPRYYFFRDWFYPIYDQYGGAELFNTYFTLLSENLPLRPRNVPGNEEAVEYSRRMPFGEVLHFMSAAAGTDLTSLYQDAFDWSEEREIELADAQQAFPLPYDGNPYYPDSRTDITDENGTISAEFEEGSPENETIDKIIDNDINTKYLTFNGVGWVQFQGNQSWVVTSYSISSANDADERDPVTWTFEASNDGENWDVLDTKSAEDFQYRYLERSYNFNNDIPYSYYRFNFSTDNATILQVAEISIYADALLSSDTIDSDSIKNSISIYPNPAKDILYLSDFHKSKTNSIIRIFSMRGSLLYEESSSDVETLNVSNLSEGIYMLQLENNGKISNSKFVKQ